MAHARQNEPQVQIESSSDLVNTENVSVLHLTNVRTQNEWKVFFQYTLELQKDSAESYAKSFFENEIIGKTVFELIENQTMIMLMALKPSHYLKLLAYITTERISAQGTITERPNRHSTQKNVAKLPIPKIICNSSQRDFQVFSFNWRMYKDHFNLGHDEAVRTLYLCAPEEIQDRIIAQMGTEDNSQWEESTLMDTIRDIVTTKLSPIVHIQKFHSMHQKESETCNDFLQRLRAKASACSFLCPHCNKNISEEHVKHKFVLGLKNKEIQTAALKTESIRPGTPLAQLLNEALTIEQSIRDQQTVSTSKNESVFALEDEDLDTNNVFHMSKQNRMAQNIKPCRNCGNKFLPGHNCPARNIKCHSCGVMGHFQKMCRSHNRNKAPIQNANKPNRYHQHKHNVNSIEHSEDPSIGFLMVGSLKSEHPLTEIAVSLSTVIKDGQEVNKQIRVLPDTGANLCLLGPKQLAILGINEAGIYNSNKVLKVAGGSSMETTKHFTATLQLEGKKTDVVIYFCKQVQRFFLSRQACIDLGIVPETFPHPPKDVNVIFNMNGENTVDSRNTSTHSEYQDIKPSLLPISNPTEEDIPKLREYLIKCFSGTVFNNNKPFPKLSTPPARIHLRDNYIIPKPAFQPAMVAEHWADSVKRSIDKDVAAGILLKVPFNEPTTWCSRMVVVKKKDGSPRRTVDYQKLNQQCLREPVYSTSPFHTARQIPQHTWKSVFDAVDGYHSVEIDEASSKLTTFITPWGRYRYLRFPQGHCAAGDAFNGRVQEILRNIPRLVRIVDDMCIYDDTITGMFRHSWDLLETCAQNGIVLNESKFQFCRKTVDFAGLTVTAESVQPSTKTLAAIQNFPPPTDLTKARAFFGLTNQVQWAYANSEEMTPFRDLVKPHSTFIWTDELKALFDKCKEKILFQVRDGVKHFDLHRITCLQTDFSQSGLGYLLLQKYCSCTMNSAPVCCRDGWKLVFAGSRFTKGAETRYAPTEGELLAISWALNHSHVFTKGSPNLVVVTDHKPLLGILNDKPLNDIKNPRIIRLKEQTLSFNFKVMYNRGKWQRGPDALSRNPQCMSFDIFREHSSFEPAAESPSDVVAMAELHEIVDDGSLSLKDIGAANRDDPELSALAKIVQQGFPPSHDLTDPLVRQYFAIRDDLSVCEDNIVMFQERIVVPKSLRSRVLQILHHAHQGVEGMRARARNTVYWPGLNSAIRQKRADCIICNKIAPSQAKEPLQMMPQPQFPFQFLCIDAFEMRGQNYLAAVDKFSGWILVYHCRGNITSNHVISKLRLIFEAYGVSEKLFTDGGLPFQSQQMKEFLAKWKVEHVTSSAFYPQGNGRAELAVKTARRIIQDNTGLGGTLDCDKAARALLQYRNTPIKCLGYSPAQLLFHRDLRDSLPTIPTRLRLHKDWNTMANKRERVFKQRNEIVVARYNQTTRSLPILADGCDVWIQDVGDHGRWNRYGTILDRDGRKYTIRVHGSGRVITRNRRFLRPVVVRSIP